MLQRIARIQVKKLIKIRKNEDVVDADFEEIKPEDDKKNAS